MEKAVFVAGLVASVVSGIVAYRVDGPYGEKLEFDPRVRREYDAQGRLTMIAFDADGDLRFDTWSYMDGDRQVRLDADDDGDGRVDRREYYAEDQTKRVEYLAPDGRVIRTELSTTAP